MKNKSFGDRLASLRTQKNVSAREMSLAIGLNESYISRIEKKIVGKLKKELIKTYWKIYVLRNAKKVKQ